MSRPTRHPCGCTSTDRALEPSVFRALVEYEARLRRMLAAQRACGVNQEAQP